jgi:hypothetical protein
MYASNLGTFLQRDPLGMAQSTTLLDSHLRVTAVMRNLNNYVDNRPTFYVDPFGLQAASTAAAPATPDIAAAIQLCRGDPTCLQQLGTIFSQIANTPLQSFYSNKKDKCFRFCDDFLRRNYPQYNQKNNPDGKIVLGGGVITLEPLEYATQGGETISTAKSIFGLTSGSMTGHCVIRIRFNPPGGPSGIAYFDLGSSTNQGHYGGPDHIFFGSTPGFQTDLDTRNPVPYFPMPPIPPRIDPIPYPVPGAPPHHLPRPGENVWPGGYPVGPPVP